MAVAVAGVAGVADDEVEAVATVVVDETLAEGVATLAIDVGVAELAGAHVGISDAVATIADAEVAAVVVEVAAGQSW